MAFYHGGLPPSSGNEYELAPIFNKGLISIGNNTTGVVLNLNKMGVQVTAYMGAGMPPIENILTPYGLLGGSYLQRTVIRPRPIVLACHVFAISLLSLQKIKQAINNIIAPSNSLQASKDLFIRYQTIDINGFAVGTPLDCPVIYNGGLEGSTNDLYHESFSLNFLELAPPSIQELTTIQPNLIPLTNVAITNNFAFYRTATGQWNNVVTTSQVGALTYGPNGDLWMGTLGTTAKVFNRSGSVSQAFVATAPVNTNVKALIFDAAGNLYAGGDFNTPNPFLTKYNGSTWSAVGGAGGPPNDVVALAFDNAGNLYAAGGLSGQFFRKFNGTSWSSPITTFVGGPLDMRKGPDGNIYIIGFFTSLNGTGYNRIVKYDVNTGLLSALGSGLDNSGFSVDFLPDGRLVAGGDFVTAGGVTVNRIAVYNGTRWEGLGPGFNDRVTEVIVDQSTGEIYALGRFTALADGSLNISGYAAKWNGSTWVQVDVGIIGTIGVYKSALRATDKELALGIQDGSSVNQGGYNIVNYAGTADVFPQIKVTGPGILYTIRNYTTGKAIYFNNLTVQAGEVLTLQAGGYQGFSFNSSYYGNIANRLAAGSDLSTFALIPGTNYIVPYMTNTTGASKIELVYKNTHWSFEAGAA